MKRECRAVRRALHAYLDGELPPDQAERVSAHMQACGDCRGALQAARATRDLLRSQPQPEPPPGLAAAIKARAYEELAHPVRAAFDWRTALVPAAAAAGLMLALALTLNLVRQPGPTEVAETPAPVAGALHQAPDVVPAQIARPPAADAQPEMTLAATPSPTRHRTIRRARLEETTPTAENAAAEVEAASAAESTPGAADATAAQPAEVEFAFAHDALPPVPVRTGTVVVPAQPEVRAALACGPRISPVTASLSVRGYAKAAAPAEDEFAKGVVAGMLLKKFIQEHLVESTSTLLAVTTGTPSEDLGPAVATHGDDADRFSLCFTQAMRRALEQVQE